MFDTVITIDAPGATRAFLADPGVQQLLSQLCTLASAVTFLAYPVAGIIILNGIVYAYKLYRALRKGGFRMELGPKDHSAAPPVWGL
ncbi:hypothetical protein M413DRAFT_29900 [Hebeloma cylindrosporum]|uniref:Uncharacterized protein n=1 Tax=Hebeloma cylindrosporum TaxID=76867 RepID=A0A0C3BPW1_HEBCY|nr:hypothetical protein M413DRAFT_29900 [Hebeloma cylindrosporum h7]